MKKYNDFLTESYSETDKYPLMCKIIDSEFIKRHFPISLDDVFYVLELNFTDNKAEICKLSDEIGGHLKYYPKITQITITPDIYAIKKYNL